MSIAKVQHYVPQFLLRNFGTGKKDQLWVFDKSNDRSFLTNAKNVASESRFYDFDVQGEKVSLEPILSRIEASAKQVIANLLAADSLAILTNEDRVQLAVLLSIQLARTRNMREQWVDFPRMLRERFAESGDTVAPGSQAAQLIQDLTENDSKAETGRFLLDAPAVFAQQLVSKQWVLGATNTRRPFLISDNPLTRQNLLEGEFRGNLGLAVPGVEVYLPLSPTRALAMWCPTLTRPIIVRAEELRTGGSGLVARDEALVNALLTGRPLQYSNENVDNLNSLQIVQSERYVFSCTNDFSLAERLVGSFPHVRRGPRMHAM